MSNRVGIVACHFGGRFNQLNAIDPIGSNVPPILFKLSTYFRAILLDQILISINLKRTLCVHASVYKLRNETIQ